MEEHDDQGWGIYAKDQTVSVDKKKKNRLTAMIGGGAKEDRNDNDYYPTPPDVTESLMRFLNLPRMKIWEPACGCGAMSKVMSTHGHFVTSTDLIDRGYGESGVNFLTAAPMTTHAIITNPPFNLAHEFIEKALKEAPIVAMVLKSQFWHAKKRYPLITKNPPAYVLPLTWRPDFSMGDSPMMDMIWTVWIEGNTESKYIPLIKPKDLSQLELL